MHLEVCEDIMGTICKFFYQEMCQSVEITEVERYENFQCDSVGTASPMLFKFAKKISGDDQGASDEGLRPQR